VRVAEWCNAAALCGTNIECINVFVAEFTYVRERSVPTGDKPMNSKANVELLNDHVRSVRSKGGSLAPTDGEGVTEMRGRPARAPRSSSPADALLRRPKIVGRQTWRLRVVSISASELPAETMMPWLGPTCANTKERRLSQIRAIYRPRILRSEFEHDGSVRHPIWRRGCALHPGRQLTAWSVAFHRWSSVACGGGKKVIQLPFNWSIGCSPSKAMLAAMPLSFDRLNLVDLRVLSIETHLPKQASRSPNASRAHQIGFTKR